MGLSDNELPEQERIWGIFGDKKSPIRYINEPHVSGDAECLRCGKVFHYNFTDERHVVTLKNGSATVECPYCLARNET